MSEINWLTCCSFIVALIVSLISIPVIIRVARMKHLMDMPNIRSVHEDGIPTLGGIAIFASLVIPVLLFSDFSKEVGMNYMIASIILLFFIGVKDDILIISASKKLITQVLAALIVIVLSGIRIKSFYGIFGLYEIPYFDSILFTLFVYIVIINAFNLIDGIDGLAGGIGVIIALTFGTWFYISANIEMATLSVSLAGALIGFLYYNFSRKRKIFMGDTGSLIVGFVIATLAIKFIDLNSLYIREFYAVRNAPTVAVLVLSIPLFDALRMFTVRILRGRSPFQADKNHLHHLLLKNRFSHFESSLILYVTNLLIISLAFTIVQDSGKYASLGILFGIFFLYCLIASVLYRKKYPASEFTIPRAKDELGQDIEQQSRVRSEHAS
jgi:UDP-GlcNAc:undecaprenyl-phosphate GlcNAc-1-phosphate transferase